MNDQPMTDILDIAGNIRTPWPDRFYLLLCVVAVVVVVWFFYKLYRWYQKRFGKTQNVLPVYEQALVDLQELAKESKLSFDEKYLHLTEILKHYVTDDLQHNWRDKTLEEIRLNFAEFRKFIVDAQLEEQLLRLLERSEGIKFAKVSSQQEVFLNDLKLAENVVQHCHKRQVVP